MINTFISTYIKDKTKLILYKNNIPIEKDILPYGINIFTEPQSDITDLETFYIIKFLNLINTNVGERIMYPDYGLNFEIYLFENNTNLIINGLKNELQEKLKKYIPEITIQDISINLFDPDQHELDLNFSLLIKPINTISSLNFKVS